MKEVMIEKNKINKANIIINKIFKCGVSNFIINFLLRSSTFAAEVPPPETHNHVPNTNVANIILLTLSIVMDLLAISLPIVMLILKLQKKKIPDVIVALFITSILFILFIFILKK